MTHLKPLRLRSALIVAISVSAVILLGLLPTHSSPRRPICKRV
jgi:hypothetical protein